MWITINGITVTKRNMNVDVLGSLTYTLKGMNHSGKRSTLVGKLYKWDSIPSLLSKTVRLPSVDEAIKLAEAYSTLVTTLQEVGTGLRIHSNYKLFSPLLGGFADEAGQFSYLSSEFNSFRVILVKNVIYGK
jgi:hypothetical protein